MVKRGRSIEYAIGRPFGFTNEDLEAERFEAVVSENGPPRSSEFATDVPFKTAFAIRLQGTVR